MKALNVGQKEECEVIEAPRNIKSVFPEVEYVIAYKSHTICLEPTYKPIQEGHAFYHYIINGKTYNSFGTLPLAKIKTREKEQLSLF